VLTFEVLELYLALSTDLIDLEVLHVLKLRQLCVKVLNLVQQFLFLEFKFRHYSDSLTPLLVELAFEDFVFGFVLVKEPGHLLIFSEELIVLS
jgi:hypothetical protein